ncbi:MAG: hypothetical protein ABR964_01770 [Tepidisphaeraceae bacterium]|jgi:hypothetical protein
MSYALLWIEVLISALLWMALLAACVARFKRRWVRATLMSLASALPLLFFAALVFAAIMIRFNAKVENNWLVYATALFIGAIAGLAVILIRARPREAGMAPSAMTWRRGPLAAAWLVSIAVTGMTLWNMDLAIRARANVLAVEADALWLATSPAVPSDAQNAAILYEKAFARLRDDPPSDVNNPPTGSNSTFDPREPAMIAFLARQTPTLALLRRAANMPACRFDEDLTTPDIQQLLPALNEEREAANVLELDARHELAQGHVSNAIADIDAVFKMSRHFGQRPLLVSGLIAIGTDAAAAVWLQEALPAVTRREDIAALNLQALSPIRRIFWRTFQGEERYGLGLLSGVGYEEFGLAGAANQPGSPLVRAIGHSPLFRVLLLPDVLDGYLQLMDGLKRATLEPYFKARQQLVELEDSYSPNGPHRGLFVAIMAPSMTRTIQMVAQAEATDACAEVAVAMTRYRLDHGALPAKLEDLVPGYLDEIPLDPFDGKPLRLAVKQDQCIIYSVGPDGKDDGGIPLDPRTNTGDVPFVLKK